MLFRSMGDMARKERNDEQALTWLERAVAGRVQRPAAYVELAELRLQRFAAQNPGMTRVLIGDALVNEDERLQVRMNQFVERVELALRQAWKLAATQGEIPDSQSTARAAMMMAFVLGRWHRFAKSGFQQTPSEGAMLMLSLLAA